MGTLDPVGRRRHFLYNIERPAEKDYQTKSISIHRVHQRGNAVIKILPCGLGKG